MKKYKKKPVIVKSSSDVFFPLACVFGAYVVFHGSSSPGGGFQGGVLIASAILLVFLGYGSARVKQTFSEHKLHSSETVAELIYIVLALLGILGGLNFCINFVFGDKIFDTSMLMNDAVGYHVMGGIICLLIMMLGLLSPDDAEKEDDAQ